MRHFARPVARLRRGGKAIADMLAKLMSAIYAGTLKTGLITADLERSDA